MNKGGDTCGASATLLKFCMICIVEEGRDVFIIKGEQNPSQSQVEIPTPE